MIMKTSINITLFLLLAIFASSCKKATKDVIAPPVAPIEPRLIFKFKFDSTQVRLDNFGQSATIVSGHAAQSPVFQKISAHYIELAANDNTPLAGGLVVYRAKETTIGGSNAIDFDSSKVLGTDYYLTGRLASFIGFNNYVRTYTVKTMNETINGNKQQGYWSFESNGVIYNGQAPAGATTVPNPLSATSPIPAGSCVVTGQFANNLTITGNETSDIVVVVSLSTNNSFEWIETNADGWYEPNASSPETVTDMGIRGLIPYIQQ